MAENNKYTGTEKKFTFHFMPDRKFTCFEDKKCKEYLRKWSILDNLSIQSYSFDEKFRSYMLNDFAWSFFQDPTVLKSLHIRCGGNSILVSSAATDLEVEPVPATLTSMSFFNRLFDNRIVRSNGSIVKCFEDYIDEIYIADELRKEVFALNGVPLHKYIERDAITNIISDYKMTRGRRNTLLHGIRSYILMIEDSDNYDIFAPLEREEFLFRLFKHLCLGGSLCQYEDDINEYLNLTKKIYKDIVNVQKDQETREIRVISIIAKVICYNGNLKYYPSSSDHLQNFSYLIIDPIKQHVNVFSHVWE